MDSPKTGRFPTKVADAEGKPVAGATVMVDGTSTGTTTGTDGKFTIAAPADATLAVSFIGYETRKVAVAGKTHVEVVMHEDAQAIENVVVTAFGTTTKKKTLRDQSPPSAARSLRSVRFRPFRKCSKERFPACS